MGQLSMGEAGELTPHGALVTPRPDLAVTGDELVGGSI
jgi:hypothetical protein